MIISVHVPKTGGTTFKHVLQQHFGDKMLLDYGDAPLKGRNLFTSYLNTVRRIPKACLLARRYECIHGHFLPVKYSFAGMHNKFTIWLRDPVEREFSRYYYRRRNGVNHSWDEFCKIGIFHNYYAKWLWGFNLNRFDFIGIMENYNNSMRVFGRMFGIECPEQPGKLNRNLDKDDNQYQVDPKIRQFLRDVNRIDYQIYARAQELNRLLEDRYLGKQTVAGR